MRPAAARRIGLIAVAVVIGDAPPRILAAPDLDPDDPDLRAIIETAARKIRDPESKP